MYIRLKLNETPIFQRMKEDGKGSKAPLTESFFRYPNNKYVLLALDFISSYVLIAVSLIIGTPFFIFFGWLSDRIGRLKIILAGCAIAVITYYPLFMGLTHYVNPAVERFANNNPITLSFTS